MNQADIEQPDNGLPARGVNNLASKLMLTLMPPNTAFWKLEIIDPRTRAEIDQTGQRANLDSVLGTISNGILQELRKSQVRRLFSRALKLALVTGDALLMLDDESEKLFNLRNFVVLRDPSGNMLEVITHEKVHVSTLSPELQELVTKPDNDGLVDLYTAAVRKNSENWELSQELDGRLVYHRPIQNEDMPFVSVAWMVLEGEHYGRPMVEDYAGDINSANALSAAVNEGSLMASRFVWLRNPSALSPAKTFSKARNGDVINGRPDDYTVAQAQKHADMATASARLDVLERRLEQVFLMNSSVTRHAERVTATEIRILHQELEEVLAEAYTSFAQNVQAPISRLMYGRFRRNQKQPNLNKVIELVIVTGIEGLGHGHDINRLDELQTRASTFPAMTPYINPEEMTLRYMNALGIAPTGLHVTAQQLAQQQAQANIDQSVTEAAPGVIQQGAAHMMENS